MHRLRDCFSWAALLLVLGIPLLCSSAAGAEKGVPGAKTPAPGDRKTQGNTDWDAAFPDRSGARPLHFVARYVDTSGKAHRLEEWRSGLRHLRRRTDDRIDLHADATTQSGKNSAAQPLEYVWHIIDVQKRTAHRISTAGMLHLGMLYSYYSMAHVLTRPAGAFTVEASNAPKAGEGSTSSLLGPSSTVPKQCSWWQIRAAGQPAMLVCWAAGFGIPLKIYVQRQDGWRMDFSMESIDTRPIPPSVFQVSMARLQVRDVDEIESED